MKKRPTAHFSNQLEQLAFQLGKELFHLGADPFEKKLVLLPNHSLKRYLTSFFASHPKWSICAGISFETLLTGAFELFSEEDLNPQFPSRLALSFLIEQEIDQIFQEKDPLFSEIEAYLTPFTHAKRIWLSEELSKIFYEYSVWERDSLKKWKEKKGWKQALWNRIFSRIPCFSEFLAQKKEREPLQIHLFGFSHVPSHFYEFFSDLGMHIYFLSPSHYFWEDLCTDQERIFLEKKMEGKKVHLQVQEQMVFFLKEHHPLLANWGKVGRPLLRKLGDTESYLEEKYMDPLENDFSALHALQSDLFSLKGEKRELSFNDTSILCLSATSKLREIEALFETIQEYRIKYPDLKPKDVLVLSSDLESYFPYIQMVFGSASSLIGYSVHGLSLTVAEENSRALMSLFSLAESRFDRDSLLEFFSFTSVMRKFGWSLDEVKTFEEWARKAHVLWGLDPTHKNQCMDQNWPENAFKGALSKEGTWKEGLSRLLRGLALDIDDFASELLAEDIPSIWPFTELDLSEAELLGTFISALYSLKEDLKPVYQKEEKSLSDWITLVQKWISTYFEKTIVEESLFKDLEELNLELEHMLQMTFPFSSFKRALLSHFNEKKESFQSSHLNTVQFLSTELGASYPAEVICMIGCDEGSFPRNRTKSSLSESISKNETPSMTDQDRYFFLEMILNARRAFVCSYQRISWKDQKEQSPSLLIQDLMNELDKHSFFSDTHLKPSERFTRNHPEIPFDQSYFQEGGFHSFSPISFLSAQNYYVKEKKQKNSFFISKEKKENFDCKMIEIKKLQEFAKDPMKLYFKETLEIFFERGSLKEEEFFLSPLTLSLMKKEALEKGLDLAVLRARAKGELPIGEIGAIAIKDLEENLRRWQENLKGFNLNPKEMFSLEFSEDVKKPEKKGDRFILPPFPVEVEGKKKVFLIGKIEGVTSQGMLWLGKGSKAYIPQIYPSLLILSCLPSSFGIEKKVLFLETGQVLSLEIEDPIRQLKRYLHLYARSLKELCLIRPEWSLDFLTKTKEELEKKREASLSFKGFIDPYEEWLFKREKSFSIDELYLLWKKDWTEVFSPLLEANME